MRDVPSTRLPAPAIPIDREKIAAFCVRHHIRKMALFGSVLRTDFSPESDVDVIVEFEGGRTPGLFQYVGVSQELGALLQRQVDMLTLAGLSRHIRDEVIASMDVIYAS